MNFSSFPPLMHSPQVMSAHHLQPSPFSPDQFLTSSSRSTASLPSEYHPDADAESDEEMPSPHTFIKKRTIEVTEALVEGRLETVSQRLRRCRNNRTTSKGRSELPEFDFTLAMDEEPTTPPNRSRSPVSFLSRDIALSYAPERLSHSPQSRRAPKNRRSVKVKRCATTSSRKSPRESSPTLVRSRSPLCRWTPPAVSAFQLFSVPSRDLSTTPPPHPRLSYSFDPQPHVWNNNFPWTIASPSTSPYPSHSPRLHSPYQA